MSDKEFKSDVWSGLGVTERVAHCQIMNNEALMIADNSDPNEAAAYRSLARAWMKLADAIGHEALIPRTGEKGNKAEPDTIPALEQRDSDAEVQPDNIPPPERSGGDTTKAQPDSIPVLERSGNVAETQSDSIPPPERSGGDTTKAQPDSIPVLERSGNVIEAQSDNLPAPERSARDATEAQRATIQKFGEASDRQVRTIVRLTYVILFLAIVMLFSVGGQIWLGWSAGSR